jgi:hypothetical protein
MRTKEMATLGLFVVLGVSVPYAARTKAAVPAAQEKSWPSPDEVVAKLDSKLSLSADQKAKITPIIADRQDKLKALAADTSSTRLQKAQKMKAVYDDSDTKIKAVLNDDQKKKYDEMQAEMRDQMRERRQQHQMPQ